MDKETRRCNIKQFIYDCFVSIISGIAIAIFVYFMFQQKIDESTIANYPISVDVIDIKQSSAPKMATTFDINLNIKQGEVVRACYINIGEYDRDNYIIYDVDIEDGDKATIKASVTEDQTIGYISQIGPLIDPSDYRFENRNIYPKDIQEYFIWIEDLTGKISTYYLLYAPELNYKKDIADTLKVYRNAGIQDDEMIIQDKFGGFYIFEDLRFINKATLKNRINSEDFMIGNIIEFNNPDEPINYSESHVSFRRYNTNISFSYRQIDVDKLYDELMYLNKMILN